MDSAAVYALDTGTGKLQGKASMSHPRFDVALAAAPNNYTNGVLYSIGGGIHNTTKEGRQVWICLLMPASFPSPPLLPSVT